MGNKNENPGIFDKIEAVTKAIKSGKPAESGKPEEIREVYLKFEAELKEQEKERTSLKIALNRLLESTDKAINEKVKQSRLNFFTGKQSDHFENKEDHVKGEISQVVTKWFFRLTREQQNLLATDPDQPTSRSMIVGEYNSGKRIAYSYEVNFHKRHPVITIDNMTTRTISSL